jgi:hypothetical protein
MVFSPQDDVMVAGEYPDELMGWNFRRAFQKVFRRLPPVAAARAIRQRTPLRRIRFRGEYPVIDDPDFYGSWLSSALGKLKSAVQGGTITAGPGGISLSKPPAAPGTPGAASGGGAMAWVKNNPLIVGGAALAVVAVLATQRK